MLRRRFLYQVQILLLPILLFTHFTIKISDDRNDIRVVRMQMIPFRFRTLISRVVQAKNVTKEKWL